MEGSRLTPLEKALATVRGGVRMVEAATEDAVAAFDMLNVTGARGQPDDPFDARDPDYIRATVPAMGAACKTYFRGEVSGLEHIPAEGPVLLVGNHSGGTMIADSFVFSRAFFAPSRGPPFWFPILLYPHRFPFQPRIRVRVMPPIDLRSDLGREPDVEDAYKVVTSRMQRTLTRLANKRPIPVVG